MRPKNLGWRTDILRSARTAVSESAVEGILRRHILLGKLLILETHGLRRVQN